MDEGASGLWRGVAEPLGSARAELIAAAGIEWTGQAALVYGDLVEAELRAVAVLRCAAEDSWTAAARHDAAVRVARAAAP